MIKPIKEFSVGEERIEEFDFQLESSDCLFDIQVALRTR